MKLILGLVFTVLGLLLVVLLVFAAHRLEGQEVLTLPIASHIDSLSDGFFKSIIAKPDNIPVVELSTNGVVVFSVTILSRMELYPPAPEFATVHQEWQSNVIARIVWKGRTNECVLERNP